MVSSNNLSKSCKNIENCVVFLNSDILYKMKMCRIILYTAKMAGPDPFNVLPVVWHMFLTKKVNKAIPNPIWSVLYSQNWVMVGSFPALIAGNMHYICVVHLHCSVSNNTITNRTLFNRFLRPKDKTAEPGAFRISFWSWSRIPDTHMDLVESGVIWSMTMLHEGPKRATKCFKNRISSSKSL